MRIQSSVGKLSGRKELALLWVTRQKKPPAWSAQWVDSARRAVERLLREKRFQGKLNETFLLCEGGRWFVLAGLGEPKELSADSLRQAAASAARVSQGSGFRAAALALPSISGLSVEAAAQAAVEGVLLGAYRYEECRQKSLTPESRKGLEALTVLVSTADQKRMAEKGVRAGRAIGEAVCWARDLGNKPANLLTPRRMAEEAKAAGRKFGFRVRVLDPAGMKRLGMNAVLAVARGSHEPARFIILEYKGSGARGQKPLVWVGKGITFDSGGISIKPSSKMEEMKFDMCGGAAVLAAVRAAAALKLPAHVVGLVPATENLPGGGAQKPGDLIRAYGGKTIEVINTDAEGRLVLADALGYAGQFKPGAVVDLATLTGACVVALGAHAMGLMGNDAGWVERVKEAACRSGERVWELPLWPDYSEAIRSTVADVKNVGDGKAGTITAAAFLKEFVEEGTPWVHLDIAGTAWADGPRGYTPKGGTGCGVRLLVELAKAWKGK